MSIVPFDDQRMRFAAAQVDRCAEPGFSIVLLPHFELHDAGLRTLGGRVVPLPSQERQLVVRLAKEGPRAEFDPADVQPLGRLVAAGYVICLPPTPNDAPPTPHDLILSPHIDDAALSLGATIAVRRAGGVPQLVLNVFADQGYQTALRVPPDRLTAIALAEDALAGGILGYRSLNIMACGAQDRLGLPLRSVMNWSVGDVRSSPALQRDVAAVARRVAAHLARLPACPPIGRLFLPAAIGGHLDHILVALAGCQVAEFLRVPMDRVVLFEDLPYAAAGMPGGVGLEDRIPHAEDVMTGVGQKQAALAMFWTRLRRAQAQISLAHGIAVAGGTGFAERVFLAPGAAAPV